MSLHSFIETDIEEESRRVKELDSLGILDSLPEKRFDDITALASYICGTEVSLITLMDSERNWFKSINTKDTKIDVTEMPRDISFCQVTIQGTNLHEIKDALHDPNWMENPIVEEYKIRYYAGYPLISSKGFKIGTLCVIDRQPQTLNAHQKSALRTLANSVVAQFELDKGRRRLKLKNKELAEVNARLYQFARMIAHDLKSPLQSIKSLYELMRYDHENINGYKEKMFHYIQRMSQMIDGMLAFSRNNLNSLKKEKVDVGTMLDDLIARLNARDVIYRISDDLPVIKTEGVLLEIIFQNLIANAIKYCQCSRSKIEVGVSNVEPLTFFVKDNGPGISKDVGEKIFDPLERLGKDEKIEGCGIGLYTVKTILIQRGGKIWYESTEGQGTTFFFEWKI